MTFLEALHQLKGPGRCIVRVGRQDNLRRGRRILVHSSYSSNGHLSALTMKWVVYVGATRVLTAVPVWQGAIGFLMLILYLTSYRIYLATTSFVSTRSFVRPALSAGAGHPRSAWMYVLPPLFLTHASVYIQGDDDGFSDAHAAALPGDDIATCAFNTREPILRRARVVVGDPFGFSSFSDDRDGSFDDFSQFWLVSECIGSKKLAELAKFMRFSRSWWNQASS